MKWLLMRWRIGCLSKALLIEESGKSPMKLYTQDEVEAAVAALIASTKRVRRSLKLLEIVHNLEIALTEYGSLSKLADAIGIPSEMLRQFSRVDKLIQPVKQLIADGAINGVDVADRLSRLPVTDQLPVANAVIHGNLTSNDVRAIVSLRKALPKEKIGKVIERVKNSRSIKQYVIEFLIPSHKTEEYIRECFVKALSKRSIVSFSSKRGIGLITLNADGKRRLEDIARQEKLTKRALINKIISGAIN